MSRSIVRCEKRSRTHFDSEHISPLFRRCFRFCDFVSSLLNVKQCRIPSRRWQGRRSGRLFHSLFRRVKHVTGSKFFDRSVESLSSTRWRRGRKVKENLLVPCSFKYSRNNLLGTCLSFFGETFSVTADVRYKGWTFWNFCFVFIFVCHTLHESLRSWTDRYQFFLISSPHYMLFRHIKFGLSWFEILLQLFSDMRAYDFLSRFSYFNLMSGGE